MKSIALTASLLVIVTTLSGCNLFTRDTTVIVPQPASGAYVPGAGCIDGFGAIQSGTEICVGASG